MRTAGVVLGERERGERGVLGVCKAAWGRVRGRRRRRGLGGMACVEASDAVRVGQVPEAWGAEYGGWR